MAIRAVIQSGPVTPGVASPIITLTSQVVVVKKSYTSPARKVVTLRTSRRFQRTGTLTRSSDAIRFFTAASGGTEITFNGVDNVFPGNRLRTGVRLFAEGDHPSGTLNDVILTLTLAPGPTPVGAPATLTMTAVELTLNIFASRPAPGVEPLPLPQPPAAPPPAGTATDKWFGGRLLNVQDPGNTQARALLVVGQVQPNTFADRLILRQVRVNGNNVAGLATRVRIFDNELPAAGETAKANPHEFNANTIPAAGLRFFVQGHTSSTTLRDTGFQLGIKGVENDGDRVALTVGVTPFITLATPVVVVKKPYTNPARKLVTLRTNAAFNQTGTLTRSSDAIRFFTAASGGTEITFNGVDNVFSGARLTTGVRLFAEGDHHSNVDDVHLTLTLTAGATPPAGLPTTARLTAVELTLDICEVRTAAGVDPPALPGNDKINPGRHVQVRTAVLSHRRAMLIVRQANPNTFAGELVLIPMNARVQAFADEVPAAGQAALANPHIIPNGTIPPAGLRFFAQGVSASTAVRDTGYRLGIRNLENDGDRVIITTVQIELIATPTAVAPAQTFVRIGLWDRAFNPTNGVLRNDRAEAANFIGRDTRRFFIRVRDASRAGELQVQWRTLFGDNTNDDVRPAPASPLITLTETAAGSHVFISKALFLVTDTTDKAQVTNSGLPAAHADAGDRTEVQTNHRIRLVTIDDAHALNSRTDADYTPPGRAGPVATATGVVFNRSPEERRRIRIHLVNVRATVGGVGILTVARRDLVKRTFQSIYAVCGIFAEVNEIVLDPPASCIGWPARYPADPIAIDPSVEGFSFPGANLVASGSQNDLIAAVRARPDFDADDIYVICVARVYSAPIPAPPGPGLVSGGGEAFPDAWVAAASTARGFAFVGVVSGITEYAEVHEATHITTNLRNVAGGHFDLGAAAAATAGNIAGKNLMHRFFLTNALGVSNPKRLWDTIFTNTLRVPNMILPRQINGIRSSRFVHPF